MLNGKLSVVMPGYNEGSRVYANLFETVQALREMAQEFEIVFVNDGSTDDTLQNAQKAAAEWDCIKIVHCSINRGKGSALKAGVEEASGEYIAFLDGDLDVRPSQLKRLIETMEEKQADVVIGSKLHPDSQVDYPRRRRLISYGYYLMLRIFFQLNVRDTQTGIKLFKAPAIKPVMRKILVKGFAYDIEVLAIINRMKFRIVDAPIKLDFLRGRRWGRITIKDVLEVFKDTLMVFYRMYILKYYD